MSYLAQYKTSRSATRFPALAVTQTLAILIIAIVGIASFASPVPTAIPVFVPNPTVTGPIPPMAAPGDPSHQYPFFSTTVDLAGAGYIEEEFFFEGTANTYDVSPLVSKLDAAKVTSSGHPYRTRLVVRRPLTAENFNGTVIMEWQNVSAGYDLDALWVASYEHLIRRGYAWIGVSVQRAGVYTPGIGLRAWSPSRYGALDVTEGNNFKNDELGWDIFSQAGQAVRNPQGVDPMGGLPVERVFAAGWSQSAVRLCGYHNSIHPLAGIFDAFALIGVDGQQSRPLRTDLDVKVFKVLNETNVAGNQVAKSQAFIRGLEPDTDHFRRWEVAGAAQLDYHEMTEGAPLLARDNVPGLPLTCDFPPFSRIPFYYVINAACDHIVNWVEFNLEPPHGQDIDVETLDEQISVLARDSFGNALGGIRLAQHAVATATNTGLNTPATNFCRHLGSYIPFEPATLEALYPNHGKYVSQVARVTNANLRDGYIVPEDADATIREAAQSEIGK